MDLEWKGQSPFCPGQPVPVELFTGREEEIKRILRSAHQVAHGKPQAIFITGEYGIGKSSLAGYIRRSLEFEPGLLGFHIFLGGLSSLDELIEKTVETIINASSIKPNSADSIRNLFTKYVGEQKLFGIKFRFDQMKKDFPNISQGFLPFLRSIHHAICKDYKGIILIYDEINGIAKQPDFGSFLKNLVDENALSDEPLPLFLIVCGTEERYRDIVDHYKPVERIFDMVHIDKMNEQEMSAFFQKAFSKAGMNLEKEAESEIIRFSGGLPRLMHLIGDAAFWIASEKIVNLNIAQNAIVVAAGEVGKKHLNQQVYKALKSEHYRAILAKLARLDEIHDRSFTKKSIESKLNSDEKKKLSNFLTKMKELNVIIPGEERGEYYFRDHLTYLYFRLRTLVFVEDE